MVPHNGQCSFKYIFFFWIFTWQMGIFLLMEEKLRGVKGLPVASLASLAVRVCSLQVDHFNSPVLSTDLRLLGLTCPHSCSLTMYSQPLMGAVGPPCTTLENSCSPTSLGYLVRKSVSSSVSVWMLAQAFPAWKVLTSLRTWFTCCLPCDIIPVPSLGYIQTAWVSLPHVS